MLRHIISFFIFLYSISLSATASNQVGFRMLGNTPLSLNDAKIKCNELNPGRYQMANAMELVFLYQNHADSFFHLGDSSYWSSNKVYEGEDFFWTINKRGQLFWSNSNEKAKTVCVSDKFRKDLLLKKSSFLSNLGDKLWMPAGGEVFDFYASSMSCFKKKKLEGGYWRLPNLVELAFLTDFKTIDHDNQDTDIGGFIWSSSLTEDKMKVMAVGNGLATVVIHKPSMYGYFFCIDLKENSLNTTP